MLDRVKINCVFVEKKMKSIIANSHSETAQWFPQLFNINTQVVEREIRRQIFELSPKSISSARWNFFQIFATIFGDLNFAHF